jgi:Family of unknown function (DUF5690)
MSEPPIIPNSRSRITAWLERAPAPVMNTYAIVTAFSAYFCVYAFRKPFTAATYDGLNFANLQIQLKTALVVSQIIGYMLAKYAGIKYVSESSRGQRAWMVVALIAWAELAMVLFAIVPNEWKVVAILLNGFPLGMIWGLMVRYLEGRRASDILLAGLSISFIVASGVFKDVGRAVMAGDAIPFLGIKLPNPLHALDQFWMPSATGFLFTAPFLLSLWLLNQLPEPTPSDVAARTEREPMDGVRRRRFLSLYLPGIALLVTAYAFLTAFRDYRDNYLVDVLKQLGYGNADDKTTITYMEMGVGFGVLATMGLLYLIKNNQRALLAALSVIVVGFAMMGVATLLHVTGQISGYWWAALIGLGSYMAYVPYNSVLFDRLMASTGFVGTAVFAIYVADSAGYTCSIGMQIGKDMFAPNTSRLQFLENLSLFVSTVGATCVAAAGIYFWQRGQRSKGS